MLALETEGATTTKEIWSYLKVTEKVFGTTKPHQWRCEIRWWGKEVDDAIQAKHQAYKIWKAGKCTRAS